MYQLKTILMNTLQIAFSFFVFAFIFSWLYRLHENSKHSTSRKPDISHVAVSQNTDSTGCLVYHVSFINDCHPSRNVTYNVKLWMVPLLKTLKGGPKSFGSLLDNTDLGVDELMDRIAEVEMMGIVRRAASYGGVSYSLTQKGRSLINLFDEINLVLKQDGG